MKIYTIDDTFIAMMDITEGEQLITKKEILVALQSTFTKVAEKFREEYKQAYAEAKDNGDITRMECLRQTAWLSGEAYKITCLAAYEALNSLQSDRQTITE